MRGKHKLRDLPSLVGGDIFCIVKPTVVPLAGGID